jgi:hypothetical protein
MRAGKIYSKVLGILTIALTASLTAPLHRGREENIQIDSIRKTTEGRKGMYSSPPPFIISRPLTSSPLAQSKPLTIKQQNISSILHPSRSPTPPPIPTHAQEQAALRSETISAFHKSIPSPSLQVSDSDSDSDGDDLLVLRNKTKDEAEREEDEYRKYLEGAVGDDVGVVLGGLDVGGGREVNEVDAGKEKEKRKKGKRKEKGEEKEGRKEADDQEFLVKCVDRLSLLRMRVF